MAQSKMTRAQAFSRGFDAGRANMMRIPPARVTREGLDTAWFMGYDEGASHGLSLALALYLHML